MRIHSLWRSLHLAVCHLTPAALFAQQYTITTFAGGAPPVTPASALSTSIGLPAGIGLDAADHVYFSGRNCIFRLDPNGVLTRIAGNSRAGYAGDGGPAIDAQIAWPNSVAVDPPGNIYITDNYRVRMISTAGVITTVAGNGEAGFSGDGGSALAAQIGSPDAIAVDGQGNIYLADYFHGIRRISANGTIATIAGTGVPGYSGDGGPAINAQLNGPESLAVDPSGNLYIADSSNYRVRKITPDGIIITIAGTGAEGDSGDGGPATAAQIDRPDAIAFDRNGNLYIAASSNFRVRKISPAGVITTVYAGDPGPGSEGVAIGFGADSAGNVYLSDVSRYRIRRISEDGTVIVAAGNGILSFSGDGGLAVEAQLFGSQGIALDSAGNLYVADGYNSRVRRISPAGVIATVAGNGTYGYAGDGGPATQAEFYDPWAVAVDRSGNLYIADAIINRIRKVSTDGIVTTVAGVGTAGFSGDGGPATASQLDAPTALAVDSTGALYIADAVNHRVRKVSPEGIITTVAGNGSIGSAGEGGPATSAELWDPVGVAVDGAGNLYIVDQAGGGRLSRVSPEGILTALTAPGDIGGPPKGPQSTFPNAVAVDGAGNIYVTDSYHYRVRMIPAGGTIVTIAGNGASGYSGDYGPATLAELVNPVGLAVDAAGKVYIADSISNAIRRLDPITSSVTITAVTNAASNLVGPVSPGEVVVLYGWMLGPPTLTIAAANSGGQLDPQLGGASVSVNGIPAPILYVSYSQVGAIVPEQVSAGSAQVSLTWQGQSSPTLSLTVAASAPALFTLDGTGRGQVVAVNQDGSVNGEISPAPAGSVVSLFMTGAGRISSGLSTAVTLGSDALTAESVAPAAGWAEGLVQINVRIPAGMTPGNSIPVAVAVGGVQSPSGPTLAIGAAGAGPARKFGF